MDRRFNSEFSKYITEVLKYQL